MPTTLVDIANSALVKIGQPTIATIDDATVGAQTCKARIDFCKRSVLRMHPWNCATARVLLDTPGTPPETEFTYAFTLPTDFIRVLEVGPNEDFYRIEGKTILTDSSELELKYIKDAAIADLDELCLESIAAYLAWDISYKITQSSETKQEAWRAFRTILPLAKSVDAQEERDHEIEADLFIRSRRGRL